MSIKPSPVRILSSVPKQLYNTEDKIFWIKETIERHRPDIFITPQEFFGGAYIMPQQKNFLRKQILPNLQEMAVKNACALVIGIVERFPSCPNKEAIWFIDELGEFQGAIYKLALPKYDHINTNGYGQIEPETSFEPRFQTFVLHGINVTAIFCWEAFSDILWTGIGLKKPDIVFSMIKFGVNSWPKVFKDIDGQNKIGGFGYGSWPKNIQSEIWIDRLYAANRWQVKCPIVCSTNSWDLKPISMPLCGTISAIPGQAKNTLWTTDRTLKKIPEKIIIDEINPLAIRSALANKFLYKDMVGEFPPFELAELTMMLKINRLQTRLITGTERLTTEKKKSSKKYGFDLYREAE